MDESVHFHGFPDNDTVRATVQEKLARLKRMKIDGQHEQPNKSFESITHKRPTNRFLKRADSKASLGSNICLSSPESISEMKSLKTPTEQKTPLQNIDKVNDSDTSAETKPKSNDNGKEATPLIPAAITSNDATLTPRRGIANKFLQLNSAQKYISQTEATFKHANNALMLKSNLAVTKAAASIASAANDRVSESTSTNHVHETIINTVSEEAQVQTEKIVIRKSFDSEKNTNVESTPAGKDATDPEMPSLVHSNIEKPSKSKKTVTNKQPSPAKRAASVSDFPFLSGQSSRSKRTIVPNKRFFSSDSPPPILAKQPDSNVNHIETMQTNNVKSFKKSEQTANTKPSVSSKKRSVSGDTVKTTNRKRKLSAESTSTTNGSTNPLTEMTTSTSDTNARPRRTIIPNRKFLDEDVITKEPALKKVVEMTELKRKRRKSEKGNHSTDMLPVPNMELAINTNLELKEPLSSVSPVKEKKDTGQSANIAKLNGNKVSDTTDVIDDIKVHVVTPESVVKVDDEVPLPDSETEIYRSRSAFLGTCILRNVDHPKDHEAVRDSALICCGVCSRVKKYRCIPDKRKRGSFLCLECVNIVNKIFQTALKAKPFSCILGPPVCEGMCPLIFSPEDQFCQACFAKTCLKNLPMKDDIYFKVWRSIPPMSRGCVSTTPFVNAASPHVGKVAYVNDEGEITSVTGSLKMFLKKPTTPGGDNISEDSSSSDGIFLINGNGDLNSARITKFPHRAAVTSNRENSVPGKTSSESPLSSSTDNLKDTIKTNGVAMEEILLGRQIGQERAVAQVDPILKPDLDDIEIFGFPVIVSGPCYPRKPLCFLCGSAGIEQLIYCSLCCEPFHPYCAGDDLLMDTYVARCNDDDEEETSDDSSSNDGNINTQQLQPNSSYKDNETDLSRFVLKWNCRRCLSCKACGDCIGRKELIRCNRCQNAYHLETCIDKQILSKIKDRNKLKKAWTCDVCMKCRSCGKTIEFNRRLRTIQEVAAAESSGDEDDDSNSNVDHDETSNNSHFNCLMLCQDCFKQRKKGSYCPLCEVCYDDNDWDSKMMECCKCNRWTHATCEKLSDEQYYVLGKLPDYIEYICKLCHFSSSSGTPLWYDAIQSQLIKECNTAVRLFEQKSHGTMRRKRSSTEIKPSYVCNLFGDCSGEESYLHSTEMTLLVVKDENIDSAELEKRNRRNMTRTVSYKEMIGCKVYLRDFVKYPKTLQENWYALKMLGVDILCDWDANYMREVDTRTPTTPIHTTPKKLFTPSKHIYTITNTIKNAIGSVTSLRLFYQLILATIDKTCDKESEKEILKMYAKSSIVETFPWFEEHSEDKNAMEKDEIKEFEEKPDEQDNTNQILLTTDPFKEIFWNSMDFFDDRMCSLCGEVGDFPPEHCGRLLWCGVNEWIHCNCAIWSSEVWEYDDGALQQVGGALNRGKIMKCKVCGQRGATVSCCNSTCKNSYHFKCAMDANCFLLENKTMFCPHHKLTPAQQETLQEDMKVGRKVFVDLEWIHKRGIRAFSHDIKIFIGSLKIDSLGIITPISIAHKEWTDTLGTVLLPNKFCSQRIFWSMKDPWVKECYTFRSGISSNDFGQKVCDVGVNLVIDHSKNDTAIHNGMEGIRKFHQWIQKAPRFIDENLLEWLPPCNEEFCVSDDDESGIDTYGRSSPCPSSASSMGSFKQIKIENRKRSPYSLRRTSGVIYMDSAKTNDSLRYTDSADSYLNETPKSTRTTRQMKRRRSSCKTRLTPRKRCKLSSKEKYESPRRKSMRNRQMKDMGSSQTWEVKRYSCKDNDSDNDSGVTDGTSSTGNIDEERVRCRVNLISQFNTSFEEHTVISDKQSDKNCVRYLGECESFQLDDMSVTSSSNLEHATNTQSEENMNLPSQLSDGNEVVTCAATIKFEVLKNNSTVCHSCDVKQAWMFLFEEVCKARRNYNLKELVHPIFSANLNGTAVEQANSFRMLGVSHRSVQFLLEQLPDVSHLADRHKFCYGHKPYIDPDNTNVLQPNSAGSSRCEGFKRKKPFDMFGWLASKHRKAPMSCDISEESSRSQGLPLAMQFRDLKEKARKKFVVLHSEIHGRGLFARCDVEKGEMLIEYAGEVIRPSLSDPRERYYESRGIGCYMFRIKTQVIDATLKGNAARFINHSCEPNCEAKTVKILGKDHIIIFALRKIFKGEELTYDYKFEREEDKIPCSCGAVRCRKYMN